MLSLFDFFKPISVKLDLIIKQGTKIMASLDSITAAIVSLATAVATLTFRHRSQ